MDNQRFPIMHAHLVFDQKPYMKSSATFPRFIWSIGASQNHLRIISCWEHRTVGHHKSFVLSHHRQLASMIRAHHTSRSMYFLILLAS